MSRVFQDALQQSIETTRHNLRALDEFPESFKHGVWRPIEKERAAGHWVDGFWTGSALAGLGAQRRHRA